MIYNDYTNYFYSCTIKELNKKKGRLRVTNDELLTGNHPKLTVLMERSKQEFTKSEKKVYDFVLEHFEEVIYQSLTEIALACKTGESTVLRFCRKIGFKGYQDFKFALAQELASVQKSDHDETFIDKVKNNMLQAIENTEQLTNMQELQKSIDLIASSNDIVVFGISASGIAGLDMQNRLLRIGKNIEVITDSHMQVMRTVSMNENSIVVAISLTGSTKDIVDAVQNAKEKGAKVIAITNYTNSPLTKYSDQVLLTSAKENPLDSGSLVSKVSQLFIIDLLCTGITMNMYDKAKQHKEQVAEVISSKLY
ncbi:MurR/RpiR family transcriptional regulator [Halalkalibacter krulwichiae]|uniref:Putative HTH-type transcriptional regulator YbbH n=1 Tax=Halalkalibacter krulwichiae TaxID=199441 RepID=A0A1X9MB25_9BACI|nr:MurR/RpiR family transcriptional regulator [Halalkalibacter krulwichiae]ARK29844.1 putative HTH-type transcriptional regulator YbbH [Halalkalibacter krulwichiae]